MWKRDIPLIYFNSFNETYKCCEAIEIYSGKEPGPPGRELILRLHEAAEKDDRSGSGYLQCLAMSYVFSARNVWPVAKVMASNACVIARNVRDRKDMAAADSGAHNISGREAAYVKAVALRIGAMNIADLKECRAAMHEVRTSLMIDQKRQTSPSAFKPLRFDTEEMLIESAEFYFFAFDGANIPDNLRADEADQLEFCLKYNLIHEGEALMERWIALFDKINNAEPDEFTSRLKMRAAINYLVISMLTAQACKGFDREKFRSMLETLKAIIFEESSYVTKYHSAIVIAATCFLEPRGARKIYEMKDWYECISSRDVFYSRPYDNWRFQFFEQIVSVALT